MVKALEFAIITVGTLNAMLAVWLIISF